MLPLFKALKYFHRFQFSMNMIIFRFKIKDKKFSCYFSLLLHFVIICFVKWNGKANNPSLLGMHILKLLETWVSSLHWLMKEVLYLHRVRINVR